MRKISFLLGVHNHQPIGNFDGVFEEAYQKSYAPFVQVLLRHPSIRWNLHCTGILWQWIEARHPDFFGDVKTMVDRGQLELLSGGFYEPILPVLPDADKVGQIEKLSGYLASHFGAKPSGMWCAERVWEPHLPGVVRRAGIRYTTLDDTHFLSAGLKTEALTGYYRVEELDDGVDIFPISQELRYTMPFREPKETIDILARTAESSRAEDPALVMADDGEKFGLWPKTYKHVYEDGWLDKFLGMIEDNAAWIRTETFSGFRARSKPAGRIYLPSASYFEMSGWSLPADSGAEFAALVRDLPGDGRAAALKRFLKGGIWRNFLVKYPEANSMYKKMLRVSRRVHERFGSGGAHAGGAAREAFDRLWAGQCNCSYWHGVFGGLYLPILRQAIYKNLIEAEKAVERAPAEKQGAQAAAVRIAAEDFDGDGAEELLIESPLQNLYFSPAAGGSLFEWDFKPASVNLGNVLTRRPEIYHSRLREGGGGAPADSRPGGTPSIHEISRSKEEGLENLVSYDWYRRASFLDHFPHPGTTPESFRFCRYGEQGDYVSERYDFEILRSDGTAQKLRGRPPHLHPEEGFALRLFRRGAVWMDDKRKEILLEKILKFPPLGAAPEETSQTELEALYRLTNLSGGPLQEVWFGCEFNLAFSTCEKDQDLSFKQARLWRRRDPHLRWGLELGFCQPTDGWVFPLETVSSSEDGFERTFQGLTVFPHWKFSLAANAAFERTLKVRVFKGG